MIKVNLLKNRSQSNSAEGTVAMTFDKGVEAELQREAVIKILAMSVFTVVIVIYETMNTNELKTVQQGQIAILNGLQSKIQALKKETDPLSNFETKSKELEDKMKIMKELSKARLRELKALDHLQTIIPERAWLKSLKYSKEKFLFNGFALTDDDLTDFVQALDKSVFFNDVILMQAKEETTNQGTLKSFEISSIIGVSE